MRQTRTDVEWDIVIGYGGGLSAAYVAPWWKDIPPAEHKDNILLYDENVQGPRGRFGKFSFAGTTRTTPPGEIGKDTFVGCMISDRNAKGLPLDAALQVATVEFRLKADGKHWDSARYCSGHEWPSLIVAPDFASLCVRYRITRPAWGHGSSDTPWEGMQQWFLCKDRLLGMLTIRAVQDNTCAGVWGRLRFGMLREIEAGESGVFRYGGLLAKIHAHDFAGIETAKSETLFLDPPEQFRSREILLKDEPSASRQQPPFSYKAGQQHYFIAEVLPRSSDAAKDVTAIREGSVLGFSSSQNGKRYVVLHNESETPAMYPLKLASGTAEVFAPAGDRKQLSVAAGVLSLTIPANWEPAAPS